MTETYSSQFNRTLNYNTTEEKIQSFIQLQLLQDFHLYVVGIGSLILCLLGLVGNIMTLVVLCQHDMHLTTYTFLTGLSVADIMVCIAVTMMNCLTTIVDSEHELLVEDKVLPHIYPILRPAALTSVFISIWITVALTTDRYIAVCHGMDNRRLITIPCARRILVVIFVLSILYNIPTFLEYEVQHLFVEKLNKTAAVYMMTDFGKNVIYQHIYRSWMCLPILWAIPFLCLLYMNTRLMIAVNHTRNKCKELKQTVPRGLDVTIMLSAVIIMFLLCQTPHLICSMVWALHPQLYNNEGFLIFSLGATLLVLLNSSTNFLIFAAFGKGFRRKFIHLFCRRCEVKGTNTSTRNYQSTNQHNNCPESPLLRSIHDIKTKTETFV